MIDRRRSQTTARHWTRTGTSFLVSLAVAAFAVRTGPPVRGAPASACGLEGVERVVAIGDVHGAADRLVDILRTTGLIDARQKWSGGRAHLVQLGDVVDRGPDSRKALDLLHRLEGEAASAGGRVHVLLGNHEVARMLGDLRYVVPGEYEAFTTSESAEIRRRFVEASKSPDPDQLLKDTPLGQIEMLIGFGSNGTYGKWLRTLDTTVKINGVVFVHGGISPGVAPLSCDEINTTVRRELTADFDKTRTAPLASLAAREDGPGWYRGLAQEADSFAPQVDDILLKQKARAIVVAHTVSSDGRIHERFGGKVIEIDTGMQPAYVPNGRASALEIHDAQFTAVYEDRREALAEAGLLGR